MSVPRTNLTNFEFSKRLPNFYGAEHGRFRRFAQEQSAIVLASMLACHTIAGERRVSAGGYSVLLHPRQMSIGQLSIGQLTQAARRSPEKNACQLTSNRALLPA